MSVWSSLRAIVAILAIAMTGSGCGNGAIAGSAGPTATSTPMDPASPPPAAAPTASPPASAPPPSAMPSISAQPPPAVLAADGGDPVVGQLGTYTWADGGSDSPWLPGAPITVGAGEPLTVSIPDGVAIAEWTARRVRAGTSNGTGAVTIGSGRGPVTFAAPGRGTWSVHVDLRFADGLGSAAWYWLVTVS